MPRTRRVDALIGDPRDQADQVHSVSTPTLPLLLSAQYKSQRLQLCISRRLLLAQMKSLVHRSGEGSPPKYDGTRPQELPPAYALQSSFKIGSRVTSSPFVSTSQLKTHLRLLGAFKELRTRVEQHPDDFPVNAAKLAPEKRWIWFLELALERFNRWVEHLECESVDDFIAREFPPLDVLLIWHAYMLNPIWYAEDCNRLPVLDKLRKFKMWDTGLLEILAKMEKTIDKPSTARNSWWLEVTSLPFDPIDSTGVLIEQDLKCPMCDSYIAASYIACDGEDETGYAQGEFKCACSHCNGIITREKLAVAKFARDVAKYSVNIKNAANLGYGLYLPGTLHTVTNATDIERAEKIKKQVLKCAVFTTSEQEIREQVGYSMKNVRIYLSKHLAPPLLAKKILSAYNDGRPFSLDLVGAVLRQGSFIEKMDNLGWTQPGYFDSKEDGLVLDHCVARYHAFLDLIPSSETGFFVPTLDIDLAWHTHQLSPARYALDCMTYIKRFVNHDDKVDESRLSTSFDNTCRVWEQHFRVPYMHCGCPLPGHTIGQKLSRLTHSVFRGGQHPSIPPARDDSFLATHPSDHNSVFLKTVINSKKREERALQIRKRRARDLEEVRAGKMDEVLYKRGERHSPAFLVPIPLYNPIVGACALTCVSGGLTSEVSGGGGDNNSGNDRTYNDSEFTCWSGGCWAAS